MSLNINNTVVNNYFLGNGGGAADSKAVAQKLLSGIEELFTKAFDSALGDVFKQFAGTGTETSQTSTPAPVELPMLEESSQPAGSLKADGNKVTTAGGYTVEVLGTSEWKITGPDGKSTRIWGDPHVHEGDREGGTGETNGGWDFKRNSTFVLGDGTKINVTCVPGGAAGATVTGGLEIISGNDRVVVKDMEKGAQKFGTVTQDGFAHANSFQGDVFVQGKETDDWSFGGKEILGSEGMGETFKTGGTLEPPTTRGLPKEPATTRGTGDLLKDWLSNSGSFARSLANIFRSAFQPSQLGSNPYSNSNRPSWETGKPVDRNQVRQNVTRAFQDMSKMFSLLSKMSQLSEQLQTLRNRFDSYA